MKKLILSAGILLHVILQVTAQEYEYVPFPTHNAEWSNLDIDKGLPWDYQKINSIYHISNTDTLIWGMTNFKLYQLTDTVNFDSVFIGYIAEKDKRIYYNGYLLYDFNINVGDTIEVDYPVDIELIVSQIDTIELGGKLRKQFCFTWSDIYFEGMRWVEGFGSTNGLLWPGTYPVENHYKLLCYKENDKLVYYNDLLGTCYPDYPTTMDVIQDEPISRFLRLEPNPANNSINITTNKTLNGTLEIFTLEGKKMKSENVVIEKNIQITVNDLFSGVYIITFRANNQEVYYNKLLIQH